MTVLDTFYVLFKSNAEDVKKGMTDVEKKSKETEKSLKNTNELADALGKSFVKMVETGASIAAGFVGLDALKTGIIDVAKFNTSLGITNELTGTSAQSLKQMGQAAAQLNGSREGAIANLLEVQAHIQETTGKIMTPEEIMAGWREMFAGVDRDQWEGLFKQANIHELGLRQMATQPLDAFNENFGKAGISSITTDEDIKSAREFMTAISETTASFEKLEQIVGTPLLGAFKNLLDYLTSYFQDIAPTAKSIVDDPMGTLQDDANFLRDQAKAEDWSGDYDAWKKQILSEPYKQDAIDVWGMTSSAIKNSASMVQDWWNATPSAMATPSVSYAIKKPRPQSSGSPSFPLPPAPNINPMADWNKLDFVDASAPEFMNAYSASAHHMNKSNSSTINVQSVTVNTQATDGQGTADAFQAMLHDLAANHSDGVSK